MTGTRRLIDEGTLQERALLASALDDGAEAECANARARTLAVLGSSAGAAAAITSAGALKPLAVTGAFWTTKLTTLVTAAAFVMTGTVGVVSVVAIINPRLVHQDTAHQGTASASRSSAAPPPPALATASAARAFEASTVPLPGPAPVVVANHGYVAAPRASVAPDARIAPDAARTATVPASNLTEEIRALEEARGRWTAGDTEGAIAGVASYRARFPNGALAPEAAWLAANALAAQGDIEAAAREGDALRARDPRSPYVRRIDQLTRRDRNAGARPLLQ